MFPANRVIAALQQLLDGCGGQGMKEATAGFV
jgi:hypothetical protein